MTDAVVSGRSLPALQTALDLAEVGLSVIVIGGAAPGPLSALPERDPEGAVAAFYERIARPIEGADSEPVRAAVLRRSQPDTVLVRDQAGEWIEQPCPNVLGIPAVPLAPEVIRLIGVGAALRAYLDRLKPLLTVGKTRLLGELVRQRMGEGVLRRLVDPHVFERYGVRADEVDADVAAPGLNEALSRAGALSTAVPAYAEQHVARETRVLPDGGSAEFHAALVRRLESYGVSFVDAEMIDARIAGDEWVFVLGGGEVLEARAFVLDQGADTEAAGPWGFGVEDLLPNSTRVYAEIDIEQPAWLREGQAAVLLEGDWSLRAARIGERFRARLLSAAGARAEMLALRARLEGQAGRERAELVDVLGAAGLAVESSAEWSFGIGAVPFASIADRDDAEARLSAAHRDGVELLPVGRAFHGDDQGAALAHAHRGAVALRRRLLGLDEIVG